MLAEQLVYGRRSRVKYIIFKDLYNIKMWFLKEKISLDSAVIITEQMRSFWIAMVFTHI